VRTNSDRFEPIRTGSNRRGWQLAGNSPSRSKRGLGGLASNGQSEDQPGNFRPSATVLHACRDGSAFKRVLRVPHLREHSPPHPPRHSYAGILISDDVSPAYVQRQLGHATYTLTVDTYGKWLPMGNKDVDGLDDVAARRLDAAVGSGPPPI